MMPVVCELFLSGTALSRHKRIRLRIWFHVAALVVQVLFDFKLLVQRRRTSRVLIMRWV